MTDKKNIKKLELKCPNCNAKLDPKQADLLIKGKRVFCKNCGKNISDIKSAPPSEKQRRNEKSYLPNISCPDCRRALTESQVKRLTEGQNIYCSHCGFMFSGFSRTGEIKPLSGKYRSPEISHQGGDHTFVKEGGLELSKREGEWLKWKESWEGVENRTQKPEPVVQDSNTQSYPNPPTLRSNINTHPEEHYTVDNPFRNPNIQQKTQSQFQSQSQSAKYRSHPYKKPTNDKTVPEIEASKDLEKIMDFFVKFTPIFYILVILGSIRNLIGQISGGNGVDFLNVIGVLVFQIMFISIDNAHFIDLEKQKSIPRKGLPLIVLGGLGVLVNGVGIFMLIRGILYRVYLSKFIKYQDSLINIWTEKNGSPDKKEEQIIIDGFWTRELLVSCIPYISQLTIACFVWGIFNSISTAEAWYIIPTILISIVAMIIFFSTILPKLERYMKSGEIFESTGIIAVTFGVFSIGNGAGIPLMFVGILILISTDSEKKLVIPLPTIDELDRRFEQEIQEKEGKNITIIPQDVQQKYSEPEIQNTEKYVAKKEDIPTQLEPQRLSLNLYKNSKGETLRAYNPRTGKLRKFDPQSGENILPEHSIHYTREKGDRTYIYNVSKDFEEDESITKPSPIPIPAYYEDTLEQKKTAFTNKKWEEIIKHNEEEKSERTKIVKRDDKTRIVNGESRTQKLSSSPATSENQVKRIFAVLDKDVRKKYKKLDIPENEKLKILKDLIYLSKKEQLKYLHEFSFDTKYDKKIQYYIERVNNLPLERGKHEMLLKQIQYIPIDELDDYVSFLEEKIANNK